MININEYLLSQLNKKEKNIIKAHDDDIKRIIKQEIERLGPEANLNHIDVSEVTNMSELFMCLNSGYPLYRYRYKLSPDISEWDVSNVKTMTNMFRDCIAFDSYIGDWDVSNVTSMWNMFCGCDKFNQPIGDWDVSNVKQMHCMFYKARNFNQDIGNWNVSNVEDMNSMFEGATSFDQDLSKWDVSKVTSLTTKVFLLSKMDKEHKYSQFPKFNR